MTSSQLKPSQTKYLSLYAPQPHQTCLYTNHRSGVNWCTLLLGNLHLWYNYQVKSKKLTLTVLIDLLSREWGYLFGSPCHHKSVVSPNPQNFQQLPGRYNHQAQCEKDNPQDLGCPSPWLSSQRLLFPSGAAYFGILLALHRGSHPPCPLQHCRNPIPQEDLSCSQ